ncbi:TonB-dependent receptor [Sphingomonas cannabina]|uniref:TonB-dependent receptor n=1 Tax=Sphingomonas cannabina TaxID=2899123 RepID=UPI001F391F28|nr:TonB-dependent receptor [Sphingomonas cannabina]UIJ47201.1 TonB-dependent receptor [Sphingomonas cannabina]
MASPASPPAPPAQYQAVPGDASDSENRADDIIVTGYARSLEDSANAKKNATNFTDSIFAEDIGKFPDLNLAESLQRLPGVQIDRDTSGEGTYINVRGLSAGFTVLTVNGFAISTSANGSNEGRGSSLDILPSELFRRLTLSKSPIASAVEGGTAGSVDMQPIGPFDRKGFHVSIQAQGSYQDADKTTTPRIAGIVSNTFMDTPIGDFGIVVAGAYAKRNYRSEIFNTVGYTTMSLGSACPTTRAGCNSLTIDPSSLPANNVDNRTSGYGGGGGATLTRVPSNVPPELGLPAAGSPLVQCGNGVPGGTSGMSCQDLSYVIVPRLVRAEQVVGSRDRKAGMLNFEWRPVDGVSLRVDSILSESNNNFGQHDVMMVVRSYNNNIPIDFEADENNVLTSGTFGNAYFLNQSTDAQTYTRLFYRSAQLDWEINKDFRVSVAGMVNTGKFKNDSLQYTLQSAPGQVQPVVYAPGQTAPAGGGPASNLTPLNTGQYVNYSYTPGDLTPRISSNIDLANYTGWYWNSIQIAPNRQDLKQKAGRIDFAGGDANRFQVSAGMMVSSFERNITSWNVSDCAFRNNCTSQFTSQETSVLGAVPNSAIPQFLTNLPASGLFKNAPFDAGFNGGWQVLDFAKMRNAVDFDYYINQTNPGDQPGNYLNTYSPRVLTEDTWSNYLMVDGRQDVFGGELRYNAGVRYTRTTQTVAGIVNDFLVGGGTRTAPFTKSSGSKWLPSANFAYLATNSLVFRGAAARTVTRPNPQDLAPTFGLSLDGDVFTRGNPSLRPFYADNFDVGIEWYPRSRTVLTFNLWWKNVHDYPATIDTATPFAETGLVFSRLSQRQQTGISNLGNGDPNAARIIVRQKLNSDVTVNLFGQEFQWIQPLDFLVKGVGFNANVTHISQKLSGTVPKNFNPKSLIAGLAPWTYNGTIYYETKGGFSARLSYTHRDENLNTVCPCNNVPGDLYSIATDYMDAQISFPLPWYTNLKITLQAQNLLQQVQLNRYENRESQPDGATYAGRNFLIGARLNF